MNNKLQRVLWAACVLLLFAACANPGQPRRDEAGSKSVTEESRQTENDSPFIPEGLQQGEDGPKPIPEQPQKAETTTKSMEADLNGDGEADLVELIYSTPDQLRPDKDCNAFEQEILFRTTVSGKTTQLRVDDNYGSIMDVYLYSLELSPTRTAVIAALSDRLLSLHAFVWEEDGPRELPLPECGRISTFIWFGYEWEFACLDGYRVQATCSDTGYTQLVQSSREIFRAGEPDSIYDAEGVVQNQSSFDVEAPQSFYEIEAVTVDGSPALCVRQLIRGGFLGSVHLGQVETYLTWDEDLNLVLVRQNVAAFEWIS